MRTLINLINTEHGYARIFVDDDSYSYELYTYQPKPIADLFERMNGFASAPEASEAARQQLSAMHPQPRAKVRSGAKPRARKPRPQGEQSVIPGITGT